MSVGGCVHISMEHIHHGAELLGHEVRVGSASVNTASRFSKVALISILISGEPEFQGSMPSPTQVLPVFNFSHSGRHVGVPLCF